MGRVSPPLGELFQPHMTALPVPHHSIPNHQHSLKETGPLPAQQAPTLPGLTFSKATLCFADAVYVM